MSQRRLVLHCRLLHVGRWALLDSLACDPRRLRHAHAAADASGKPVVHTCVDVVRDCKLMHKVAMARRRRRFAAGALALNKTKLSFKCDPATGV